MRIADFRDLRFEKDPVPLWGAGQPSFCISPRVHDFGGRVGRRLLYSSKEPSGRLAFCVRQARPSGDGWEALPGIVLASGLPGGKNGVTAPDVVRLADGRWRMYVEARDSDAASAVIASATSVDGETWTADAGVRLQASVGVGLGTPACVADPDGGWRLYCHEYASSYYHIVSAHSADGLTWHREPGVRITQSLPGDDFGVYGPHVVRCSDGWVMVFAAWTAQPAISGAIWAAWSADGLTWQRASSPWLTPGPSYDGRVCSEPFLDLHSSHIDLHYEGCDPQRNYRLCRARATLRR